MPRLGRSTFGIAAIVSVALALATLVIGGVAYQLTHEALEEQLDQRTATETRALMAEPGADRLAAIAAGIRRREATEGPNHLGYLLVDAAGRRVAGSLAAEAPATVGYEEFLSHSSGRIAQSLTTAVPGGGRLVVAADRALIGEIDNQLILLFSVAFGAVLLLGIGGAWTVGTITRDRLQRVDRVALDIIGGDLSRRMPVDRSGSEFDRLSTTLNEMLDRITALMTNLRQVSSDVAHDLRTPLTRLRNRLEEAGSRDGADRAAAIAAATAQADEMLDIFSAVLRISEIEAYGVRKQFRAVELGEIVAGLVETYRPDADAAGHRIALSVERDMVVNGDRRLLMQLASNLLDNALRHTPAGTTIEVTLARDRRNAILRCADDGPGIGDGDGSRLFERFSRGEASRSTAGHGLGLALVAAIVAAHGGTARIVGGPGFTIDITLPLA